MYTYNVPWRSFNERTSNLNVFAQIFNISKYLIIPSNSLTYYLLLYSLAFPPFTSSIHCGPHLIHSSLNACSSPIIFWHVLGTTRYPPCLLNNLSSRCSRFIFFLYIEEGVATFYSQCTSSCSLQMVSSKEYLFQNVSGIITLLDSFSARRLLPQKIIQ